MEAERGPIVLRVFLLGNPRLEVDGASRAIRPSTPVLSLLAYLLLHADLPLLRKTLAFTFWPDGEEETALARLRRVLFSLHETLPQGDVPWIVADKRVIGWNPRAGVWLDVTEFQRLRASPDGAIAAVDLYTGDLLPDVDAEWVRVERERLSALHGQTLESIVRTFTSAGDVSAALTYALRHLAKDPLREDVVRTVMTLRAAAGDRSGAAQVYTAFVARARSELGVDPSSETVAAMERIAGSARRPSESRTNLPEPEPARPLVGRAYDVDAVRILLHAEGRSVTITGPGGVGKSRLAIETSRAASAGFRDGVWLVDFTQTGHPTLVLAEVARTFGAAGADRNALRESLVRILRSSESLLVFDNCEHVLTSAGEMAEVLLRACPSLRILATSRERLGIAGETAYVLSPLATPREPVARASDAMQFSAIQLFVDRARSLSPDFRITDHNAGAVVRIVSRTDGIPLAVELAVPWLRVVSVDELANRFEDRFGILVGTDRGERHRTLDGLVAWSYDSLSKDERRLFSVAATFAASFSVDALAAVAEAGNGVAVDVLRNVTALLDKSLLSALGGEPRRFMLLDTLREYALRRQTPATNRELRTRHARFFCELAAKVEARRHEGMPEREWLTLLESDRPNFYAALGWCLDEGGDPRIGARLAFALTRFFEYERRAEGRYWYLRALERLDPAEHELRADVALGLEIARKDEVMPDRIARFEAIAEVYRRADVRLKLHYALGWYSWALFVAGRAADAATAARECTALAREVGSTEDVAWGLSREVDVFLDSDPELGLRLMDEALDVLSDAPPTRLKLGLLRQTVELQLASGDRAAAMQALVEAREITSRLRSVPLNLRAPVESYYAALRALSGDFHEGRTVALELLDVAQRNGSPMIAIYAIDTLAYTAAMLGDVRRAARLSGFIEDRLRRNGFPPVSTQRPCSSELATLLPATLTLEELTDLRNQGGLLTDSEADAEARLTPISSVSDSAARPAARSGCVAVKSDGSGRGCR